MKAGIYDGVQALLSMQTSPSSIKGDSQVSALNRKDMSSAWQAGKRKGKDRATGVIPSKWTIPPEGWTKVNVDGSFVQATGEAGIGIVARNSSGEVVFSAWKVLFRCADAAEAEARACVEGIRFTAQWTPGRVIVESDCSRVVHAICRGEDRSDIGFIVAEARELAQLLLELKVVLVKRECNTVANELAQLARRIVHTAPNRVRWYYVS